MRRPEDGDVKIATIEFLAAAGIDRGGELGLPTRVGVVQVIRVVNQASVPFGMAGGLGGDHSHCAFGGTPANGFGTGAFGHEFVKLVPRLIGVSVAVAKTGITLRK